MVVLVVEMVVNGCDPADHLAVKLGQEVVGVRMLEERVVRAVEQLLDLRTKRRDPVQVPPVQLVGQVDEALKILGRLDAPNCRRSAQITPSSLPMRPKASRQKSIWSLEWVAMTLVRRRHPSAGTAGGPTGLVKTPSS